MDGSRVVSVIEEKFFSGFDVPKSDEDDSGEAELVGQDLRLQVRVLARVVKQAAETTVFRRGVDAEINYKIF